MVDKSDIVYSEVYGFGTIKNIKEAEDSTIYTFEFKSGTKEISIGKDDEQDVAFLPRKFIDFIKSRSFDYTFSPITQTRGRAYYKEGKILNVKFYNNSISALVSGSSIYRTKIEITRNLGYIGSCECPVEKHCKHEYALYLYLKNMIDNELDIEEKSEPVVELNSNIKDKIDLLNENYSYSYFLNMLDIVNELKEYNDKNFKAVAIYLYSQINSMKNHNIIYILLSTMKMKNLRVINLHLNKDAYAYFSDFEVEMDNNYILYGRRSRATLYNDVEIELIKSFSHFNADNILRELESYEYHSPFTYALLEFISDKISVETRAVINYKDFVIKKYTQYKNAIKLYAQRLDFTLRRRLLSEFDNLNLITLEEIDTTEGKEIFNKIALIPGGKKAMLYIIKNFYKLYYLDKKMLFSSICELYYEIKYVSRDEIISNLSMYNETKYLCLFLMSNSSFKRTYHYDILDRFKICLDTDFVDSLDYSQIDEDVLLNTFDLRYSFSDFKVEYKIDYYLSIASMSGDVIDIIHVTSNDIETYILEDHLSVESDVKLYSYYLYKYINEKYKEDIEKDILDFTIRNKKKLEEKNDNQVMSLISDFNDEVLALDAPKLLDKDKIVLEYEIGLAEARSENHLICFRVGNENKKYVVQNPKTFFENFRYSRYDTYGKKYGFYHTLDNVKSPHKEAIEFLMDKLIDDVYCRNKYAAITDRTFVQLLEILKGNFITIDYTLYYVDMNLIDYKISIDDDYKINVDSNIMNKNDEVYLTKDSSLLFKNDKNKNAIYKVADSKLESEILKFSIGAQGLSIRNTKEHFLEHIYLRMPEKFIVSDYIKNDMKLSALNIDAYFDYHDKTITLKYDLKKDDNIIQKEDLSKLDMVRVDKFLSYITELGFVDNVISNDLNIYNFFTLDFSDLKKMANVYLSETIENKQIVEFPRQTFKITYDNDLLSVFMEESTFSEEELYKIYSAIKHKKKFYLLKNNTIVNLGNDDAIEFEEIVDDFHLNPKEIFLEKRVPVYESIKAYSHLKNVSMDKYLLDMIETISKFKEYKIDEIDVDATLRGYQIDGVKWLTILSKYHLGGVLADDMGLGKTLQIISMLKINHQNKPTLIVCPKSLIFNWKNEFQLFDKNTSVIEIYGSTQTRKDIITSIDYDKFNVYITSYDSLRLDIDLYNDVFEYCILDEAQVIKNVMAQKSMSVKKIKAINRFALTGTPIENNIIDLWSIFDFLMPGYFPELSLFKNKYEGSQDEYIKTLVKKISPFILRRCKKDVLKDLPNKYERILSCDMKNEQLKLYDAYKLRAKDILKEGSAIDVLSFLTRLRQICVDPKMFVEDYDGGSEKMDMTLELVNDYVKNNHRILIFSQFVKALEIIEEQLKESSIPYYKLTGDTKAENRIKMCKDFNAKESIKVFLISLKAGGNGLNLTGADTVIHLDPWWNISAENQATDRAHRIGQTRNVEVIKIIASNSIEQRVIELQNLKKDLIDKLITNDDSSITKLSREDLAFILG